MSLYDRYQQSNSTVIPQYEGSSGEDFVKVGEYRQGQYDTAREAGNEIGDASGNLNVSGSGLAGVDAAADDLRSEVSGKIQGLTDKGDWENAIPDVKALGRHFANRSAEIMAPINALATYKKGLDEKELNLTPDQKAGLVGISVDAYNKSGGLQKNPRGQYQGTSIGVAAAKNIDVNKKVDEWMKDFATHKGGTDIERDPADGALWIVKNGVKTEKLDPREIDAHIRTAAKNDNEFTAYQQQEGALAGHKFRNVDPSQLPDGMFKQTALGVQQKHPGLNFSDALNQSRQDEVLNNASIYAMKYKKDDKFTERTIKMDEWTKYLDEKADRLAKAKADFESLAPIMTQGANTKTSAYNPDYKKASEGLTGTQNTIAQNTANIKGWTDAMNATKDPAARTQYQTNIADAKNTNALLNESVNRTKQIESQAQLDVAQKMGFHSYQDFLDNGTKSIDKAVSGAMGDKFQHIETKSGRSVTRQDIVNAIVKGKVSMTTNDVPTGAYGATKSIATGATVTLDDGTKVPIPESMGGTKLAEAAVSAHNDTSSRLAEFQKKVTDQYKSNVNNLSIATTNIDIPNPKMRESITNALKSNIAGVKFVNPGEIESQDAPKNFRVISASTAGGVDETRTKVELLEDDGKGTGKYMDAITTNDNINQTMSQILATAGTPEAQLLSKSILSKSTARRLGQMVPGQTEYVPNAEGRQIKIEMNKAKDSQKIVWNLIDEKGDILASKSSAGEAAQWLDSDFTSNATGSTEVPGSFKINGGVPHVNPKHYAKRPSS